jgi:nickel/cobalt exporter
MTFEITALAVTAASIGFFHTLFGPDHYLPFIVMSRAGKWSLLKTSLVTLLCGVGHVLGSVVLGLVGVVLGVAVARIEGVEGTRGNVAAWLLIGFGLAYAAWGVRRALRNRPHVHVHAHEDGGEHQHKHAHGHEHVHAHGTDKRQLTPWILFTIFVFGPCEPLIPILMYPAAKQSVGGMLLVTAVFAITTIGTMFAVVMAAAWGVSFARFGRLERYTHAIAGATICLSGLAIQFLGL